MTAALARVLDDAPVRPAPARRLDPADCDLAVAGLEVRYGAAAPVFSDVSFTVGRGEAVALIGPNGTGKSTLLKCCLGFVRPVAGEVRLFGEQMVGLRPFEQRRLRGGVGFVAQKHNLVARLSVLSNVIHGMLSMQPGPRYWLQALASAKARARALTALDRVGLADLSLRRADSLSGGQSQRVAIARALIAEPRLILADEPAASLDPAAGEDVMAVFARVVRDTGTTLLFTTHHLEHALSYAGRVVGLRGGRLALDAPARDLQLEGLLGIYG